METIIQWVIGLTSQFGDGKSVTIGVLFLIIVVMMLIVGQLAVASGGDVRLDAKLGKRFLVTVRISRPVRSSKKNSKRVVKHRKQKQISRKRRH